MRRTIVTKITPRNGHTLSEHELMRIAREVEWLQRPRLGAVLVAAAGILLCLLLRLTLLVRGVHVWECLS